MKLQIPRLFKKIRPEKLAYYVMIGAVALVVGSFAMWRLISYFSPQQLNTGCDSNNVCTKVRLGVSDYSEPFINGLPTCPGSSTHNRLSNSLDDPTPACLADNTNINATTLIDANASNYNLFRLQGQVLYK